MSQKPLIVALVAIAVGLSAPIANAHPALKATTPSADSVVASPPEIRLNFSEGLVSKFSGVNLKDEGGKLIETGPAAADPKDKKQLVVPLKTPLATGRYTVEWHAVSEDTHRVKGSYSFKVDR